MPRLHSTGARTPAKAAARDASTSDGYVGSAACSVCHYQIYSEFKKTHMGRSLSGVTPALLNSFHLPSTYYDPQRERHYEIYAEAGKMYQSQFQLDASGKDVFRDTHQVRWIIGSGMYAYGPIIARGQYLFEAPLGFYTHIGAWRLEPGYEFTDLGFNRPVLAECLACHSGRSTPIPATNGKYDLPVFSEMSIGCERCHGPGAAHIAAMKKGDLQKGRMEIVNPAHLTPVRANELCMSCHELGNERILKPGKRFQDYIPGTPLSDTFSVLIVPPNRKSPPKGEHLQQYYQMILSKCYRSSGGKMQCITCHDPHIEPTAQEAPGYFNSKCLTCHTKQSCSLSPAIRQRTTPADNCVSCHMPKSRVQVIAHSSLTNHRIIAHPGEPFPDAAFEQTTPSLPDLIDLDPAPGKPRAEPPLLTLLQAYGDLASYQKQYVASYLRVLDELSRTDPEHELVQAALGRRDLMQGKFQQADTHLRHALRIGPPQAVVYGDLADAEYHLGRKEMAVTLMRKGIEQDPYNPELQRKLVYLLISLKREKPALLATDHYLKIFPQDASMRQLLTQLKAQGEVH